VPPERIDDAMKFPVSVRPTRQAMLFGSATSAAGERWSPKKNNNCARAKDIGRRRFSSRRAPDRPAAHHGLAKASAGGCRRRRSWARRMIPAVLLAQRVNLTISRALASRRRALAGWQFRNIRAAVAIRKLERDQPQADPAFPGLAQQSRMSG